MDKGAHVVEKGKAVVTLLARRREMSRTVKARGYGGREQWHL
jgi:hypothetical protein